MARQHLSAALLLLAASAANPSYSQQNTLGKPAIGSVERKAILDALRKVGDIPNRVFVVRSMRVQDGWAWVVVDSESRDRSSHYETESALLKGAAAGWKVVDRPCEEDGCDPKREIARIRAAHPEAPAGVFQP